jgi:hypothetical protein
MTSLELRRHLRHQKSHLLSLRMHERRVRLRRNCSSSHIPIGQDTESKLERFKFYCEFNKSVYNALLEETLAWQFIEDLKKDGRNFRRAGGIFAAEGLSMLEEANTLMYHHISYYHLRHINNTIHHNSIHYRLRSNNNSIHYSLNMRFHHPHHHRGIKKRTHDAKRS